MAQKNASDHRKEFGAKVRAAREGRRMDAEVAAKHLEISISHLYGVEAGRTNTSAALRKRLEGFIAAASSQPSGANPADDDVMPVIRALASLSQTRLSAEEFGRVVDAYRACISFGLAFGAEQAKQVLAKTRE